ncbi:MAG: DNA polymerase III subunit delta' [Pseudomonadota bacterium]
MKNDVPSSVFPWQAENWLALWQLRLQERLAHAFLFVGMDGIGKRQFAATFTQALLCAQPTVTGDFCRECHSCRMISARTHPDLLWIEPEASDKKIQVDQIRDLIKKVNETTLQGGYRVIIINPASAMNMNAANALLKTLEEPVAKTLLILINNLSLRLPATIVSRCQKLVFKRVDDELARQWLQQQAPDSKIAPELLLRLAQGAPLKALALIETDLLAKRAELYEGLYALTAGGIDPVALAAQWDDVDQVMVVDLILSWLTDLLRYKMTEDGAWLVNADFKTQLMQVSTALPPASLTAYLDEVQQTRHELGNSINLNKQLMLENLFIRWTHYVPG